MAQKASDSEQVTAHIDKIDKPNAEIITWLRQMILGVDGQIAEHIKWNAPAFYFSGKMKPFDPKEYKRDLLVINLHRGKILLVFPTGAKIEDQTFGKHTPDGRKIVEINSFEDAKTKQSLLQAAIKDWLSKVEI
jgi:hypothetical protein